MAAGESAVLFQDTPRFWRPRALVYFWRRAAGARAGAVVRGGGDLHLSGIWIDGNLTGDRAEYSRRQPARHGGKSFAQRRTQAGRGWRNIGARTQCFPGLLESSPGNARGLQRWLVQDWRHRLAG